MIGDQKDEIEELKTQIEGLNTETKRSKAEASSMRKANTKLSDEIKEIRQELGITQVKIAGLGNILELEQVRRKLFRYNSLASLI
jgi:uncharacterized coiled-coil DUF342 family protein